METLKIVIKAKIATAQENLLKEEIHKLFERIFLTDYDYSSQRIDEAAKPDIGQEIIYDGNLYPANGIYLGGDTVMLKDGTYDFFDKWKPKNQK